MPPPTMSLSADKNDPFAEAACSLLHKGLFVEAHILTKETLGNNPKHHQALYTQLYCSYFLNDLQHISKSAGKLLSQLTILKKSTLPPPAQLILLYTMCQQIIEITSRSGWALHIANDVKVQGVLVKLGYLAAKWATKLKQMYPNISSTNRPEVDFMAEIYPYRNQNGEQLLYYRPQSPCEIQIEPTNACNMQCVMCTRNEMQRPEGQLGEELFEQILSSWSGINSRSTLPYLLDSTIEHTHGISGGIKMYYLGEPLLNKRIYSYISQARERGATVGIQTNAVLLGNPDIRSKLLDAAPNFIGISLDGISPESFEKIRVGGSWSQTVAALLSVVTFFDGFLVKLFDGCDLANYTLPLFPSE